MIDYFCDRNSRANSPKVAIMLEECGAEYRRIVLDIYDKPSIDLSFYRISPAGTVPAILDHDQSPPLALFESCSILVYLADRFGRFLPSELPERTQVLQWLFWQSSQLGPTLYTLNHFVNRTDERCESTVDYFLTLGLRWLQLLDERLIGSRFVGTDYSIADMAIYPFVVAASQELDLDQFTATQRWLSEIGERPAVQAALPKRRTGSSDGNTTTN